MSIEKLLQVAGSYNGVKEDPAGSNIQPFGEWYGMNGVAWCAIYVSYCFDKIGKTLNIETDKGFHYCPNGYNHFKKLGKIVKDPKPGDIVFFDFNKDGWTEHVGIVDKIAPDNKTFYSWEGNTSKSSNDNGGSVMYRQRYISQVKGFARVLDEKIDDISGHWAENTFKWALENNIISGYKDGSVKPNNTLTRAEMLTILKNYDSYRRKE